MTDQTTPNTPMFSSESAKARRPKPSMPVGIHSKVSYAGGERGTNFTDFFFEDEHGRSRKKRVYDPSPDRVYPYKDKAGLPTETDHEAYVRTCGQRVDTVYTIVEATAGDVVVEANTYEDYVKKALAVAKDGAFVNLKVTYDWKGEYPDIPDWGFVEAHTDGNEPTLYFTKKDIVTPKAAPQDDSVVTGGDLYDE